MNGSVGNDQWQHKMDFPLIIKPFSELTKWKENVVWWRKKKNLKSCFTTVLQAASTSNLPCMCRDLWRTHQNLLWQIFAFQHNQIPFQRKSLAVRKCLLSAGWLCLGLEVECGWVRRNPTRAMFGIKVGKSGWELAGSWEERCCYLFSECLGMWFSGGPGRVNGCATEAVGKTGTLQQLFF